MICSWQYQNFACQSKIFGPMPLLEPGTENIHLMTKRLPIRAEYALLMNSLLNSQGTLFAQAPLSTSLWRDFSR